MNHRVDRTTESADRSLDAHERALRYESLVDLPTRETSVARPSVRPYVRPSVSAANARARGSVRSVRAFSTTKITNVPYTRDHDLIESSNHPSIHPSIHPFVRVFRTERAHRNDDDDDDDDDARDDDECGVDDDDASGDAWS